MRHLLFTFVIITFSFTAFTQDTLLIEDNPTKKMEYRKGPNSNYFSHLYYGITSPIPPQNEGAALEFWNSYGMEFGYRNKIRVCNFYSLGFNLSYAFNRYRMKQEEGKVTPDTDLYDKQSIRNNEFRLGFYNRFNFDTKRGNIIGKYLDLGVYGTYHFRNKVRTESEIENTTYITIQKKLDYVEPWGYGVFAHLGSGSYIITFDYRLSPYFTEDSAYPDLPQFTVGIQLGLHD